MPSTTHQSDCILSCLVVRNAPARPSYSLAGDGVLTLASEGIERRGSCVVSSFWWPTCALAYRHSLRNTHPKSCNTQQCMVQTSRRRLAVGAVALTPSSPAVVDAPSLSALKTNYVLAPCRPATIRVSIMPPANIVQPSPSNQNIHRSATPGF